MLIPDAADDHGSCQPSPRVHRSSSILVYVFDRTLNKWKHVTNMALVYLDADPW